MKTHRIGMVLLGISAIVNLGWFTVGKDGVKNGSVRKQSAARPLQPQTLVLEREPNEMPGTGRERVESLLANGVPREIIEMALVPEMNRRLYKDVSESASFDEAVQRMRANREMREEWIVSMFGEKGRSRVDRRDKGSPLRPRQLEFALDVEDEFAPDMEDGAKEAGRSFENFYGVELSAADKQTLIKLMTSGMTSLEIEEQIRKHLGPERSWVMFALEEEHRHFHKMALALAAGREKEPAEITKALFEIGALRADALAEWEEADMAESLKLAGRRKVEEQILNHVERELGAEAAEVVRLNGW